MDRHPSDTLQIVLGELADLNVRTIKLVGRVPFDPEQSNAWKLAERLRREARAGVLMDYSECVLDHTLEQYTKTAQALAAAFPDGVRIAYCFAPANMVHAAFITKQFHKAGFAAAAFSTREAAIEFLRTG